MRTISQNDQETVVHKEQRKLPSQGRSFCLLGGCSDQAAFVDDQTCGDQQSQYPKCQIY